MRCLPNCTCMYNRICRYETMIMKRCDSCRFLWREGNSSQSLPLTYTLIKDASFSCKGESRKSSIHDRVEEGRVPLTLTPRHTLLPFSNSFPYSSSQSGDFSTHSLPDHLSCPGGFVPWLSCVWSLNHVIYNLPACLLNLLPDQLMILYPPFLIGLPVWTTLLV